MKECESGFLVTQSDSEQHVADDISAEPRIHDTRVRAGTPGFTERLALWKKCEEWKEPVTKCIFVLRKNGSRRHLVIPPKQSEDKGFFLPLKWGAAQGP